MFKACQILDNKGYLSLLVSMSQASTLVMLP